MDFHNYLHDFVLAKDKLAKAKESEKLDKDAPLYNPFMEEANDNQD